MEWFIILADMEGLKIAVNDLEFWLTILTG